MNELALQRRLSDVVKEYNQKVLAIPGALADFEKAGDAIKSAACVGGTWGDTRLDTGHIHESEMNASLLKSAWLHIYGGLNIDRIATAQERRAFKQALSHPIPFTVDNIRATFGDFIIDPRGNILRGLAEVFCGLDPAYKSHDKVRIGVKGLPKRIIIDGFGGFTEWGRNKLTDVLNALAAYQCKPLVSQAEISELMKYETAMLMDRGIRFRLHKNGNGHLFFEPHTLTDINRALAEYYGEVLPDCSEEKPEKRRTSTEISKDLQYYPTPKRVVEEVLSQVVNMEGQRILEPSCGCGRFMDAIRARGASVFGIEVHAARAEECRAKGHKVLTANFLETVPNPIYDRVIMNPPFYGKHYAKHVNHALKFLKPGGTLTAVLPATARYDHGLLKGRWYDLPVGSFSESGTNINTTILTMFAERS